MIKYQKLDINECEFLYLRQALSDPPLIQRCHLHHLAQLNQDSDESH